MIQVPERFETKGLLKIDKKIQVFGLFGLILEDGTYGFVNANTMITISPYKHDIIKIDGIPYYQFYFYKDSLLIPTRNTVKDDLLMFPLLDEVLLQGKVPWYMNYEDLGKIFDTASDYAGSRVSNSMATIELIAAFVGRDNSDLKTPYRHVFMNNKEVSFVGLRNVYLSAPGTVNKLAGNYATEAIVSALVNESKEMSDIEEVLRA
jgi:hypothetical protein